MKRSLLILVAGTLILVLGVAAAWAVRKDSQKDQVLARLVYDFYGAAAARQGMFVGSEMCLACHSGPNAVKGYDASGWKKSFHARPFKEVKNDKFSMVEGQGVVADANGNKIDDFKDGLDLNTHNDFKKFAPNAPKLGYSPQTGYTITIGEITYRVFFAHGGNGQWKERYVTYIPVTDRVSGLSAGKYVLPIQYNIATKAWVTYNTSNWYDSSNAPIFNKTATSALAASRGNSFDKGCSGCHFGATAVRKDEKGEYVSQAPPAVLFDPNDTTYFDFNGDGIKEMTHIGCESCHGPGSMHVLQYGAKSAIIKPVTDLSARQANELCGRCHLRGKDQPGIYDFPYDHVNDHDFIIGDDLYGKYWKDNPGLWPDAKTSRQHRQQFQDFYKSKKPTSQFGAVRCYECHDIHVGDFNAIRKTIRTTEGSQTLNIPVRVEDNTLCLACHATHGPFASIKKSQVAAYAANKAAIGQAVEAHSKHPYAPERTMGMGRCTHCHMPKTAQTVKPYDITSHTFEVVRPNKTIQFQAQGGMPNACAVSCHRNIVDIFPNAADTAIGTWTEASDVSLANWLVQYFGPNGKWWKHQ